MKIKELRKKSGKTQTEVANFLNITQEKYSRIETGKTSIDSDLLKKLADYFHTTVDYLIDHEVPYLINKSQFSSDQLTVIESIQKLDKEQIAKLIAYIDGLKDGKNR